MLITPEWPAPANVRTCITRRAGGVSSGPYASNNLGLHVGDDPARVMQNRNALAQHLQLRHAPQWLEQVHGVKVIHAKTDNRVRTADGSYTDQSGVVCTVMTADCLPILLCDKHGTQVAAIHCGWRSLAKGICARALQKFSANINGINGNEIIAYLGPAISQMHFEVGVDVLDAFFKTAHSIEHQEQVAAAFMPGKRPLHFYADIYALARAELCALGITAIYGGGYCTYEQRDAFFSYRRDGKTGRMASLIWLA